MNDYLGPDHVVRFIEAFIDSLDLTATGFGRTLPKATGCPGYDPGDLLKLYVYGYLNRVRSSRRLEAEAHRNLEVIWLMRQLQPDFKTIADFRRENRTAFRQIFRAFVVVCNNLDLFGRELIAVDGARLKAVNSGQRNFTKAKLAKAMADSDERLNRYLKQLDDADKDDTVPFDKQSRWQNALDFRLPLCAFRRSFASVQFRPFQDATNSYDYTRSPAIDSMPRPLPAARQSPEPDQIMPFDFASLTPFLAMGLLAVVFVAFALELRSPDVIAFCGAVVALATGLVSPNDLLAAIANPAPATIGAMFVLSAALVRTGVLEAVSDVLSRYASQSPTLTIGAFFAAAAVASAFMNNTPVVMVLIPIVITLAREMKQAPSHLLIPLSYMVILGGTCSLIGTSTNLLVDGIAQDLGLVPFSLFEIAPVGIVVAIVGGAFLAIAAPRLLPVRETVGNFQSKRDGRTWLVELFIPASSPLVGKTVLDVEAFKKGGSRAVDLVRSDLSLRDSLASSTIQAGDTVVIKTVDTEILGFKEGAAGGSTVLGAEPSTARRTSVVEILIGPNSRSLHRMIGRLRWRRRFGVYPIALHRNGAALDMRLATAKLAVGDTLLLEGSPDDIVSLVEEEQLIVLSPFESRPYRRTKAPIAVGTMVGVVLLAALNVAPILTLALIGVVVVLLTNCIDADEGVGSIDGRLLLLIVSMLTLGTALDNSGALTLIVSKVSPLLATVQPIVALALVYALTSFLTELVTNNAVAVLVAPIAAGIAVQLGLDPRPFVVAVMFGASASFATPIGYQTNTLVYNAGGYKFTDFLRIGIPMNIIVGAVTVLLVPWIWPLSP